MLFKSALEHQSEGMSADAMMALFGRVGEVRMLRIAASGHQQKSTVQLQGEGIIM